MAPTKRPQPVHIPGATKGEETVLRKGREPGRVAKEGQDYRTARDSTSINAKSRDPIDPRMPHIPPA